MKVKFKVNAEWEEEVPDDDLMEIAREDGIEGDIPSQKELDAALKFWIEDREDSLRDNPTSEIDDAVEINVSHEIIS